MDERLVALERFVAEQQARTSELSGLLDELREESFALRECLVDEGVLPAGAVPAAVARRAARCHGASVSSLWGEVTIAPGVIDNVARTAGAASAGLLSASSRALNEGLGDTLETWSQAEEVPRVVVVGGADGDDESFNCLATVEAYDPATSTWVALPPMPNPRTRCAAVATGMHLYIIGGYDRLADEPAARSTPISVLQRFDPWAGAWEELPELGLLPMTQIPTAAAGLDCGSGVRSSEMFYVISGRNCELVEKFDTASGVWEALPPRAPMAKGAGCCAVVLGGKLYVTGGLEGATQVDRTQVDCWDPATGEWATAPPMRTTRIQCSAAALDDMLFIVGGRSVDPPGPVDFVEAYDPKTEEWSEHPSMPTARAFCSAIPVLGSLLVVGGRAGGARLSTVEVYDPHSRSWAALPSMPTPRSGCAAVAVQF